MKIAKRGHAPKVIRTYLPEKYKYSNGKVYEILEDKSLREIKFKKVFLCDFIKEDGK